jgi:hypothetical protein
VQYWNKTAETWNRYQAELLAGFFTLVSCLDYSLTLKMETICPSEVLILMTFNGIHGIIYQKTRTLQGHCCHCLSDLRTCKIKVIPEQFLASGCCPKVLQWGLGHTRSVWKQHWQQVPVEELGNVQLQLKHIHNSVQLVEALTEAACWLNLLTHSHSDLVDCDHMLPIHVDKLGHAAENRIKLVVKTELEQVFQNASYGDYVIHFHAYLWHTLDAHYSRKTNMQTIFIYLFI